MRHLSTRRALVALSLFALLFTVDAAFDAELGASAIAGLILGAGALAWVILRLSEQVLHGSRNMRIRAIVALNVIGAMPSILLLRFIAAAEQADIVGPAMQATVGWLIAVIVWTTSVSISAAHKRTQVRIARGNGIVPLYRARARPHGST